MLSTLLNAIIHLPPSFSLNCFHFLTFPVGPLRSGRFWTKSQLSCFIAGKLLNLQDLQSLYLQKRNNNNLFVCLLRGLLRGFAEHKVCAQWIIIILTYSRVISTVDNNFFLTFYLKQFIISTSYVAQDFHIYI